MGGLGLRAVGERLLGDARAVRAAYPDRAAMLAVAVSPAPADPADDAAARSALGYLRDEVELVRAGRAGGVAVLDDELALAERLLADL